MVCTLLCNADTELDTCSRSLRRMVLSAGEAVGAFAVDAKVVFLGGGLTLT